MKTSSAKAKVRKARRLFALFRLTLEEREKLEAFQKVHPTFSKLLGKRLGTDHCHKTGLIRGVLDFRINRAYGMIEQAFPKNIPVVLRALADYHEKPPAEQALNGKRYGLIGKARHKKKMVYGPPTKKKKAA